MQAVQVVVYPFHYILLKCQACFQWLIRAWRGMFNRPRPIKMRCFVPTRDPSRPKARSQRSEINRGRPEPAETEEVPRARPVKRPANTPRKIYLRPAVIPLKWYEAATQALILSDKMDKTEDKNPTAVELPVPQEIAEPKSPKSGGRKKWQKPTTYRSANPSVIREDGTVKSAAKNAPKEKFVNKRWSY